MQLQHNSLVALRSYHDKMSLYLSVFRNEQGVFLPAITDSGDLPMWRVQKVGGSTAQFIKEGETIRLCWRFSDQTCGFRDFCDDIYGRRRFTKPENVEDNLYLRTPFPGFERSDTLIPVKVTGQSIPNDLKIPGGNPGLAPSETPSISPDKPADSSSGSGQEHNGAAMVMSPSPSAKPILSKLSVIPDKGDYLKDSITYNLFDVTFRIDVIGELAQVYFFPSMRLAA
jgi:hypothetical protein